MSVHGEERVAAAALILTAVFLLVEMMGPRVWFSVHIYISAAASAYRSLQVGPVLLKSFSDF